MQRRLSSRSGAYAAALAAAYASVAIVYVLASSRLAADASASVEEMARIETLKDVVFVLVTAALVFVGARISLRRMTRDAEQLRQRDHALLSAQSRVVAGLMASSVAHDANNVLVNVLAELDELAESSAATDRDGLERLRRAAHQLVELNRRMVTAASGDAGREREPVDLVLAARRAADDVRGHADLRGCDLQVIGQGEWIAMLSPVLVQRIVANLLINAAQATGGRGRVELRVTREDDVVALEVHDDGPGVPPEKREGLFAALETTKEKGAGLGLFSVRACAESLGGEVSVGDSPLGGALFRVTLPLQRRAAPVS